MRLFLLAPQAQIPPSPYQQGLGPVRGYCKPGSQVDDGRVSLLFICVKADSTVFTFAGLENVQRLQMWHWRTSLICRSSTGWSQRLSSAPMQRAKLVSPAMDACASLTSPASKQIFFLKFCAAAGVAKRSKSSRLSLTGRMAHLLSNLFTLTIEVSSICFGEGAQVNVQEAFAPSLHRQLSGGVPRFCQRKTTV